MRKVWNETPEAKALRIARLKATWARKRDLLWKSRAAGKPTVLESSGFTIRSSAPAEPIPESAPPQNPHEILIKNFISVLLQLARAEGIGPERVLELVRAATAQ